MVAVELFSYADAYAAGPVDRLYAELVELAVRGDELGFGRLWLTEQHLGAPGRVPDSLQMLAFLAARTSRIRLATAVLPAAVHEPLLLVESVLQLEVLSGGRVDIGIGSGSEAGGVLEAVGTSAEEASPRTAALYALLAQVRPGARVSVGTPGHEVEVVLDPAPLRPLLEHVWTAAGRTALELTTAYRTGLLLPRPMPLEARRRLADAYREAVPDGRVVHFAAGLVGPTRNEARRRAAAFVQDYARRYLDVAVGGPDSAGFDEALERLGFAVGTADEVADLLRARVEPFDPADAVAIQFGGPGARQEHVLESLELLAPLIPELAG